MARLREVSWKDKTPEVEQALILHSPENYLKVILENYFLYNSYARSDIAKILQEKWQEARKSNPQSYAVQKNIFLEIYSKYIQVTEDLALVGRLLLLRSKTLSSVEIYMESDNSDTLSFYKSARSGFSDAQLSKIMGVDKLRHFIKSAQHLSSDEIKHYDYIIDESIKIERNNFMMLAKIYIEEAKDEDRAVKLIQAGPIDVYNGIKHGFKLVHPTKLTKSIWKDIGEETVEVMHQVIVDKTTGQKLIGVGGFESANEELVEHIMYNIETFSQTLHSMCELRLWTDKDPMFVIKKFRLTKTEEELKKRKIGVNEKCPCGSGMKFKKCCKLFKDEYEKSDPFAVVELS